MRDVIASWSAGKLPVPDREAGIPLRDVRLRLPVADPSKIIAAPVNYRHPAITAGRSRPPSPAESR
jgi:hypothetical protein